MTPKNVSRHSSARGTGGTGVVSRVWRGFPWIALMLLAVAHVAAGPPPNGWRALALRDLNGEALPAPRQRLVAVFLDPECPVANGYIPVLNALAADFGREDFCFVGVYTDPNVDLARLQRHAREYQIKFDLVDDRTQTFARHTGATYSAEAVVLAVNGDVLYRGRIDDRVGSDGFSRPAPKRHDLREVLTRLAAGERGPFPGVPGFGCSLAVPAHRP